MELKQKYLGKSLGLSSKNGTRMRISLCGGSG